MSAAGARWEEARLLCPAGEYTAPEWRQHYADHPDDLMQILGDIFRVYKSEERKRNGQGNPQGGRRKAQIDGSLDELWEIITPKFSDKPIAEAFKDVVGKRSVRAVAMKMGTSHQLLLRKLNGTRPLYREDIEDLAKAVDVHPAYFIEWRVMVVQELVAHVMTTNPNLSIRLLKGLSQ